MDGLSIVTTAGAAHGRPSAIGKSTVNNGSPPRSAIGRMSRRRRVRAALAVLLEAWDYSQELSVDPWDFAVEVESLLSAGLSLSDVRWFVALGAVEFGVEVTPPGGARIFERSTGLILTERTCLVLTPAGLALARRELGRGGERTRKKAGKSTRERLPAEGTPHWDHDHQELRCGTQVLHQFKVPDVDAEVLLATFQESGWQGPVEPPAALADEPKRLGSVIAKLNNRQRRPMLRFELEDAARVSWRRIGTLGGGEG